MHFLDELKKHPMRAPSEQNGRDEIFLLLRCENMLEPRAV
jgi:hypothetical protein